MELFIIVCMTSVIGIALIVTIVPYVVFPFLPKHWVYYITNRKKRDKVNDIMLETTLQLYSNGIITAKINKYNIVFSDSTSIWVENKYYAYGKLSSYRGNDVPDCKTSIKLIKKIMELEATLNGTPKLNRYN